VSLCVKVAAMPGLAGWKGRGFVHTAGAGDVVISALPEAEGVGGIKAVFEREVDDHGADGPITGVCGSLDCRCQGVAIRGHACDVGGVRRGCVGGTNADPHRGFGGSVGGPRREGGGSVECIAQGCGDEGGLSGVLLWGSWPSPIVVTYGKGVSNRSSKVHRDERPCIVREVCVPVWSKRQQVVRGCFLELEENVPLV